MTPGARQATVSEPSGDLSGDRPTRFLVAMFQGGGNIPLIMPIVAELAARGHEVRVLAGPGIRRNRLPVSARFVERIEEAGATLVPFQSPETHPLDEPRPSQGLTRGSAPIQYETELHRATSVAWSPAWAENVTGELRRAPADVVVADFDLLGTLAAAEAAGLPSAALMHNIGWRPMPGAPPRGTGLLPAQTPAEHRRDEIGNEAIEQIWAGDGLPALNCARQRLGLPPLASPFAQYDTADRLLILVSAAFDFAPDPLPDNVRYVGTPFDDAAVPADTWQPPGSPDDPRPLVLVSLSTLQQGQAPIMERVLEGVGGLAMRVVVTLGPSLDPAQFSPPSNVTLEAFVPHAAVLPHVSAMVSQCGLGTTMKALAHGIPLVCIPLVGDQPDNAARVVARGAGVRLAPDATPAEIGAAIQQLLDDPSFRESACRLGARIAAEDGAVTAADELTSLARTASR